MSKCKTSNTVATVVTPSSPYLSYSFAHLVANKLPRPYDQRILGIGQDFSKYVRITAIYKD